MSYVIKHIPEDFIVTELSSVQPSEGVFTYFVLKKHDLTTLEAMKRIAHALHVPLKTISCAGNKDRRAVTEQVCSARVPAEQLSALNLKDISCSPFGSGREPVHLGELEGNRFRIVIRNIDECPNVSARFRNLFGEQRFSSKNVEIGRYLVKREFEKAAKLIIETHSDGRFKRYIDAREWVGVIRTLPRKLALLYIHAYQSWIWNEAAMVTTRDSLPIVGFGTHDIDDDTKKILAQEGIKPLSFVIREIPELSAEGDERSVWVEAKDVKVGMLESDECFEGKKKVTLEFTLPKGSYATEFIRQNVQ